MIGAIWAYYLGQIYPQFAFDPLITIGMVLMVYLGGKGTLWGPVVGALVLVPGAAVPGLPPGWERPLPDRLRSRLPDRDAADAARHPPVARRAAAPPPRSASGSSATPTRQAEELATP